MTSRLDLQKEGQLIITKINPYTRPRLYKSKEIKGFILS